MSRVRPRVSPSTVVTRRPTGRILQTGVADMSDRGEAEAVDLTFVSTDVWAGTWLQWGDSFDNVGDLVDKAIAKLGLRKCLRRLIIVSHGAVGINGFVAFDLGE